MGGKMYGRKGEVHTRFRWGRPDGKRHLEDPGSEGRIIIK
jgi:hypothetical protein